MLSKLGISTVLPLLHLMVKLWFLLFLGHLLASYCWDADGTSDHGFHLPYRMGVLNIHDTYRQRLQVNHRSKDDQA